MGEQILIVNDEYSVHDVARAYLERESYVQTVHSVGRRLAGAVS